MLNLKYPTVYSVEDKKNEKYLLGYSVTWEFSINDNGYGGGNPISYQATVIPWQDNLGVKRIGDYYIK